MALGVSPWLAQLRVIRSEFLYMAVRMAKRLFMMPDGTCRYTPTCSDFAREALRDLPLYKALPKILSRLSRCHPWGGSGHDPVHRKP